MMKELICIVCPNGCHLKATPEGDSWNITGYTCPRGLDYGLAELTHPTRVVTSTVRIQGGLHSRLPVKTSGAIPKEYIADAMRLLDAVDVVSPVRCGDVIVENICNTGIDFVASRDL